MLTYSPVERALTGYFFTTSKRGNVSVTFHERCFRGSTSSFTKKVSSGFQPITGGSPKKIQACMDEVITVFPGEARFTGIDEGDYHVHAGATASGADIILTFNNPIHITQTPDQELYEIITPDEFFMLITDSNRQCMLPVTRGQFEYWGSKPNSDPIDKALCKAGCPEFSQRVRENLRKIALS